MPIVAVNARRELSEFYPPPYNFLGPTLRIQRRRGMGQGENTQLAEMATNYAATGATTAASVLAMFSEISATTVPVVGAIAAAGAILASILIKVFSGCGQTCVLASNEANQVEQALQQNVNAYFASPRTAADQQAALANFDAAWNVLTQYCGQPSLGQAGTNCVDARQRGACQWKTSGCSLSTGTPPVWSCGAAGSGSQCWNWFVGYRDPIANDTMPAQQAAAAQQQAASNPITGAVSSLFSATPSGGLSWTSLILPALLVGGGLLVFAGGRN